MSLSGKLVLNYIIIILIVLGVLILFTGITLWLIIPSAGKGHVVSTFLGLKKHSWKDIHRYTALCLVKYLPLIHVALNYKWILHTTKRLFKK